jgi:hypothetical protein
MEATRLSFSQEPVRAGKHQARDHRRVSSGFWPLFLQSNWCARSEALFAALMRQLGISPISKENGLLEFQRRGWVLVDATYEPVNTTKCSSRDGVIARDYPLLRDDLATLMPKRSSPLVLIKANVCRILEPKLAKDGFNVLNGGRVIYFPGTGWQREFQRQFSAVLQCGGDWE